MFFFPIEPVLSATILILGWVSLQAGVVYLLKVDKELKITILSVSQLNMLNESALPIVGSVMLVATRN